MWIICHVNHVNKITIKQVPSGQWSVHWALAPVKQVINTDQ